MEIRAGIGADLKNHTKYPEQPVSARAEAVAPEQPLKMDASRIKTELLAGLTVALALVPEAVAFAFVAGVNIGSGNRSDSFNPVGNLIPQTSPFFWYSFHPDPDRYPRATHSIAMGFVRCTNIDLPASTVM